ncbi:hypothetical protein LTS08_007070 [Lithohypha guttulata]|uniref:Uncharacterized protein n=1 Tax=Lithohypha guttulata TaxID=1690604 RepID=A0AAN7T0U0_9EURO|nr:hypothetical protein LTR51_005589 [Lithohypha guttulata]KAK5086660.1 hypothetical protein LTR05_003828 [Lithohypha guttulata]KAK5097050.1 hypothetical protein LTS08_007070 [Lithohypha guttulata]
MAPPEQPNLLVMGLPPNPNNQIDKPLEQARTEAESKGYNLTICTLDPINWPEEQTLSVLGKELDTRKYTVISIGFGVRGNRGATPMFEKMVNLCVEKQPGAKFGFAVHPTDIVSACERAMGVSERIVGL